jgi:hypothetical protein
VLCFPTSAVTKQSAEQAIVRLLAKVYREATGEHASLVVKLLERPFQQWERRQGRSNTERARSKKWAELTRAYLSQYRADVASVLSRWGFGRSRSQRRRGRKVDDETRRND